MSDLGNIHDRSIRAFAVKPLAFGAPLSGFGALPLSAVEQIAARVEMPPTVECTLLRTMSDRWSAGFLTIGTDTGLQQKIALGALVLGLRRRTARGGPFTADAVNRLIKRIGARAGFAFSVHAHMLRHSCGYALANKGHDTRAIQDWLGHRSIQHTVRYTELSPTRFKDFWR